MCRAGRLDVENSVAAPHRSLPGGLEGRGVRGATRHLPNGEERPVRRARVHFSRLRDPYPSEARICRVVRETVALSSSRKSSIFGDSDREPAEGFHLTTMTAVTRSTTRPIVHSLISTERHTDPTATVHLRSCSTTFAPSSSHSPRTSPSSSTSIRTLTGSVDSRSARPSAQNGSAMYGCPWRRSSWSW